MKIILINGKKRCGKDYFANRLKEQLHLKGKTSNIISFADPIKEILATTFDISLSSLNEYKNNPNTYKIRFVKESVGGDNTVRSSDFRKILQNFGTEAMKKHFGEDVWVKLLQNKIASFDCDYVIIPDFRFSIEYIPNAITIKIINNNLHNNDAHVSENDLNDFSFDYILDNTDNRLNSQIVNIFVDNLLT